MNSEHVPLLCVSKDSLIHVVTGGRRTRITAKKAYSIFMQDQELLFASFNHKTAKIEFQPVLLANKTESKKVKIKTCYTPKDYTNAFTFNELNVGNKHPVYVLDKGYIEARKVKPGDRVLVFNVIREGKSVISNFQPKKRHKQKRTGGLINCKICNKKCRRESVRTTTCGGEMCTGINSGRLFYTTVIETEQFKAKEEMYDFTVKKNHNFVCDGILVKNCLDEIDLIQDPKVLDEASMIPCTYGEYFPITVYLSTRKFAGGLMEKTMKTVEQTGGKVLRWNILDVTERIPADVAQVKKPKVLRYISKELPMRNISPKEYKALPEDQKKRFDRFLAYAGIANHPLLPAMRNYLVDRSQEDVGGLYKSVVAVRNNFKKTSPEMGEAQLLCNTPSSSNLVYGRFSDKLNVISVKDAYEMLMGEVPDVISFDLLLFEIKNLGLPIYGGADWGFTDFTVFTIYTVLPNGKIILLWHERERNMEIEDIVDTAIELEDAFGRIIWYPDQNYPAYIKTLKRKTKSKWKKFTKDVVAGISALQSKIVDADNNRSFLVLDTAENKVVIECFGEYKWAKDGKGNIIDGTPYHGDDGTSDTMDSIRYPMQNLYGNSKRKAYGAVGSNTAASNDLSREIMRKKIQELTGEVAIGEDLRGVRKIVIT